MVTISKHDLTSNVTTVVVLKPGIRQFDIQARTAVDLKVAIGTADTIAAGTYLTIKANGFFTQQVPPEMLSRANLYLQAASNVTVEVAQWFPNEV